MIKKDELSKYLAKLGSEGGKARARSLSLEQRREIAKKGARARWAKKRKDEKQK